MPILMKLLIVITCLIWMPLVPLRIFLHGKISLWQRLRGRSYGIFLLYWIVFAFVILITVPSLVAWKFFPLPYGFEIGLLLMAVALLTHLWTIGTLGLKTFSLRPEVTPEKAKASLVASGPYRFVRHPFYFMEWFLLMGLTLATSSWIVFWLTVFTMITIPIVTRFEEKELVERFGEGYKEYQKQVPGLIPNPRKFLRRPVV